MTKTFCLQNKRMRENVMKKRIILVLAVVLASAFMMTSCDAILDKLGEIPFIGDILGGGEEHVHEYYTLPAPFSAKTWYSDAPKDLPLLEVGLSFPHHIK